MSKYEYVSKTEYRPVREELEAIIKKVQKILKKESKITFQYELIGSGAKHLITRIKNGNKGFDFDYNFILNCEPGHFWKPDYARKEVAKAIDKAIIGSAYDHPQNSSSAIRIKVKDKKNSRIIHSCDFAVIYYPSNEVNQHKYVRLNTKTNVYTWEIREYTEFYHEKLDWLKDNVSNYWDIIKIEYLKLKNNNKDSNKHSFQLFYETINNVFNNFAN